jgi:hypothetical protein
MPSRKSKQSGGNYPLTHYERTKKFASSEYGTTSMRLSGISQYQLGDCGLSLSRLADKALCSPSGYLYEPTVILEYLLQKSGELRELRLVYESQQAFQQQQADDKELAEVDKKRQSFVDSQKVVKRHKSDDPKSAAYDQLKQASYWLSESQPQMDQTKDMAPPPARPSSPHTEAPLIRKDLWELQLDWQDDKMVCNVSGKALRGEIVGYWTSRQEPGRIVSKDSFDLLENTCHETGKKIRYTRKLQSSGTSYSASSQATEAKIYRPTIT